MQIGKYEPIRQLAVGGMAEVFLARAAGPMGFEKKLVLKRILPHLAKDSAFVEMFLAEARLAAQLNHPHIVQIFDFGEADGEYFLAMEYIDGPNLRVLLKRANAAGVTLPPALCARIIASACEGLSFAHDFQDPATGELLDLIHRDVSTDNILVSRQGAVKVVDFGIAKAGGQDHKTQSGVIKGKLAYMPPEQVRAKPLDLRADVYALGVVLYELLTGRKPHDAPTDASLMQAILFEPQVPAAKYRPELPAALQRILDRALAKDRELRYPNCRAFQIDLEDFILSTGKSVGAYQIAQLVTELDSPADTRPSPGPVSVSSQARTVAIATRKPRRAPARTPLKWISALMGTALLVAGGGYILGTRAGSVAPPPTESLSPPVEAPSVTMAPTEPSAPPSAPAALEPEAPPAIELTPVLASQAEGLGDRKPPPSTGRSSASRPSRAGIKRAGASQPGKLHLVVRGWADIWIDGERKGRVPPINELELPAGRHEVQLINPAVRPYRKIVTISPGETLEHHVVFQAAEPSTDAPQTELSVR